MTYRRHKYKVTQTEVDTPSSVHYLTCKGMPRLKKPHNKTEIKLKTVSTETRQYSDQM
jgi:hypothetical protein